MYNLSSADDRQRFDRILEVRVSEWFHSLVSFKALRSNFCSRRKRKESTESHHDHDAPGQLELREAD